MATGIPVSHINWDAARLRNAGGAIAVRLCRAFAGGASAADPTSFWALPPATRLYVVTVTTLGAFLTIWFAPSGIANPMAFATLVVLSCLTSTWKVMLPLSLSNNCTLSVSYVADLMALMLLGPHEAMIVALAGAWVQCTVRVKQRYPPYRTAFSLAAEAITMQATGVVYVGLGGFAADANLIALQKPLVGAIVTYFLVNSTIFAFVIALAGRQRVWRVWNENFLWSAPSFMVAGVMGAIAATIIQHGHHWLAVMMFAPVYLTYRTYHVFLGRIQDQQRHVEETRQLHAETVEALLHARRAEQALAAETKRLTVTLRSIGDGVITTDLSGTILLINDMAQRLTGWTDDQAIGQPLEAVFRTFDRQTRQPCTSRLAVPAEGDGAGVARCTLLAARDLTERPIEEIAAPICDAAGNTIGMVVAFRDISDALKAQEERARADKLASLGLLAGGIAHDFNNILLAVMGNVSMARVSLPPQSAAVLSLAEAEKACVRARQLTWQLLTFSKGGVPTKKTMAIPRLLEECAALVLRGTPVRCTFNVDPDLAAVHADAVQLQQVFSNILINAREAMPGGGVIEVTGVNVAETVKRFEHALPVEPGPYVRISITDTGIGIPAENVGSIFDPYFSTKQKGSGLGLATSHSIVKNHGGFVAVESRLGCGTTFHVNLPASGAPAVAEATEMTMVTPASHRGRILVMDDEPAIRMIAAQMLRYLGHEAVVTDNGHAAIEQYRHALERDQPFDAVMLDLVTPGAMGGRETIEGLTALDPDVNAIVVSGYTQDSVLAKYREYGFKAVIAKPFTLQELNSALHAAIVPHHWQVH
jgi:PAS domain S-box-containing protein